MAKELGMVIEGAYVTRALTAESATIGTARRLADQIISRHLPVDDTPRPGRGAAQRPSK